MRMGQGVRTGLGHGGITCVLQTQFSSFVWSSVQHSPQLDIRSQITLGLLREFFGLSKSSCFQKQRNACLGCNSLTFWNI